jgi:hypothetical protein
MNTSYIESALGSLSPLGGAAVSKADGKATLKAVGA